MDPRLLAWIALGGAIGAVLRYLVGAALASADFPYDTLLVNVAGSFLLAVLVFYDLRSGTVPPTMRALLGVGLLGAFTTMSAVSVETIGMYDEGAAGQATFNAMLNLVLSVSAAVAGRAVALGLPFPASGT